MTLTKTSHGQGAPLKLLRECCVNVKFEGLSRTISFTVQVAEMVTSDVILGRDFLQQNRCAVELGPTNLLRFTRDNSTIPFGGGTVQTDQETSMALVINKQLTIPPQSEMKMLLKVPRGLHSTTMTWLVEPVQEKRPVEVERALATPVEGQIPVRLLKTLVLTQFRSLKGR